MSLRLRLVLLVLLASVPLLGIALYTAAEIRRAEVFASGNQLQGIARIAENRLRIMLETSEALLYALSEVPALARGDADACARLYQQIQRGSKHNTSLVVADENGNARCDNSGPRSTLYVGDRDYFARARATLRFAAGAPVVSRLSGRTVIPVAYPLLDARGNFRGAIASGIDLTLAAEVFEKSLVNPDLILNIWDPEGRLLYPPAQGTRAAEPDSGIRRAVLARQARTATVEATGLDGAANFYVITGLEHRVGARAAVSVGIPMTKLLARSDRAFSQILISFGAVFAVCIALALALAEFTVRRRVVALSTAAQRLAAGDLSARSGMPHSRDELGMLAKGFDTMGERLQARALELRRAHEMAKLAHIVTRAGGVFESWSDTLPDLVGLEPRALPQSTREWLALVHADDRAGFRAKAIEADTSKARVDIEYRLRRADGEWIHVRQAIEPIKERVVAGDGALRWFNTLQDVSVQKRAEEEIRRLNEDLERRVAERTANLEQANISLTDSAARIRAMHDTVVDGIVTIDERGIVETVNPAAERIFGYAAAEVIGRNVKLLMPEPYHSEHDGYLERYHATGEARIIGTGREVVGLRKDGSTFPLELAVSEMRLAGDRHYTGIVRDITERKHNEEQLRVQGEEIARKNVELEEASRAKSDFLANMSHELRTPLNSIIGCSEMLKDGVLGELEAKQRGFVTDIFDAGSHLLSLINDILDLSKVEAGMLQLEAGAVDLPALLRASTLVVREKAATHHVRLDTRLDPALGTVLADERKLKQILYNLLSNAVKFTLDGGAVTLRARRCARAEVILDAALPGRLVALPPGEEDEFLAITVEDSGVGIAEEHLPKLFVPFTQVDGSSARRHAGTGLGLSLVRRLAELHGGTVGVASRPGEGSRFCVWLPYREAVPAPSASRDAREDPTTHKGSVPPLAAPLALVIEDDDRMAELIEAQLRAEGFEVMRAATGEEGLVRAAKRKPQLITLDIFLPAMDGWEFMRRLRADPKLADTPVVIITVSGDLDHGFALGARRVLQKPFVREELIAALAGLVDARPDGERARVLVVDDNVKAVELLATALEAEGYRVMRAYGGAEAIEAARRARPDLVILDLMMPEVSGFEVARALRKSEETARVPILVLTAKDLTAEDHARLNSGVSVILSKAGFSTSELLAELRRALPRRAGD